MPDTGRYTGRLFLDGNDAALFLKQHGDMVAAVDRMATANETIAATSASLVSELAALKRDVAQERSMAANESHEIREHLSRLERRFRFWPMVGRFGALLAGFGAVGFGAYELVTRVVL